MIFRLAFWLLLSVAAHAHLTLEDVLRNAERHHPKLRGVSLLADIARAKVTEKEGAFDPQLLAGSDWLRYNSPTSPGKPKYAQDAGVGVLIQDLEGWKMLGGYRNNRGDVKSPDNLTGSTGELFLEFKLPMLRGLGVNEKRTALEQARQAVQLAEGTARIVRLEVLLAASLAYWEWSAAATQLSVLEKNVELASQRAEQVAGRAKAGDLAPIESVEAQQEVARRREALAKAQREFAKAGFKLAFYLWGSDGKASELPGPEEAPLLLPADLLPALADAARPATPAPQPSSPDVLGQAETGALQRRPELMLFEFEKRIIDLDRELAENDRLPGLDLILGPGLDTGHQGIGLTYKVGLTLTVPLGTRGPDGRLRAAQLKTEKLTFEQVQEVQRILLEVRDAHSALDLGVRRYGPALEALRLARQLEEAERVKYRFGDSTLFLVNQRERQSLAEALKVIEILLDYRRAESVLKAATAAL